QQPSQVRHRQIREQVDKHDRFQRFQLRMGGGEGGNNVVIVQLKHASIEDEGQRRGEIGPDFRKQDAGYDDDQRIEEIQRAVPAAGEMDDQADHGHVRDDLQNRLHQLLFPERKQQDV